MPASRKFFRELNDLGLLHHRDSANRFVFRTISLGDFVNFIQRDSWRQHVGRILHSSRKFAGIRSKAEILKPTRRIENNQNRSFFSRKPLVRMPFKNPRPSDNGLSGTNVITPPLVTT